MGEGHSAFVVGRGTGSGAQNRTVFPTCRGRTALEILKVCRCGQVAVRRTPVAKGTKGLLLGVHRTTQNQGGRRVHRSPSAHLAL